MKRNLGRKEVKIQEPLIFSRFPLSQGDFTGRPSVEKKNKNKITRLWRAELSFHGTRDTTKTYSGKKKHKTKHPKGWEKKEKEQANKRRKRL
jgi:hypothetical protein